jgi:hypothetical protein
MEDGRDSIARCAIGELRGGLVHGIICKRCVETVREGIESDLGYSESPGSIDGYEMSRWPKVVSPDEQDKSEYDETQAY